MWLQPVARQGTAWERQLTKPWNLEVITALLAQKYEPLHAAVFGVYLHGLAADITLEQQSEETMLASDVIESLGAAFGTL